MIIVSAIHVIYKSNLYFKSDRVIKLYFFFYKIGDSTFFFHPL